MARSTRSAISFGPGHIKISSVCIGSSKENGTILPRETKRATSPCPASTNHKKGHLYPPPHTAACPTKLAGLLRCTAPSIAKFPGYEQPPGRTKIPRRPSENQD